jgi:hypothetical protein
LETFLACKKTSIPDQIQSIFNFCRANKSFELFILDSHQLLEIENRNLILFDKDMELSIAKSFS